MTQRSAGRLDVSRLASTSVLAALWLTAAGCGTAARPGPVAVEEPRVAADSAPSEATAPPRVRLRPVEAPVPRPWLPVGLRWSPTDPREGEAVFLSLVQPVTGRVPLEVEAVLGERPVPLARTGGGWFGVAPLPIGEEGPTRLEMRFRLPGDTTVVQRATIPVADREFPATTLRVAPGYSDPSPDALRRIRSERERITAVLARATPDWLPEGPFLRPRQTRVTSPFGQRRLFNGELRSRHTGLDLAGRPGAPVRAAARGRVALTGDFYFAGNAVYLDHGLGVYTGYFHLSDTAVSEGDTVPKGAVVGSVGSTGRVTGPHLHWSLYVDGVPLDAGSLLRVSPVWEDAEPSP